MTIRLHHVAINAPDPTETAEFYRDSIDVAIGPDETDPGCRWLAGANFFVALHPADADSEPDRDRQVCDPGIGHFCVQSGDGEALWQRLADGGMRFNDRPVALGTGAIYAYGRDRDATLVEVEGVPNAEPQTPIWFAHVAIVTPDIGRLADFYARFIDRDPHRTGRFDNPLFSNVTGMPDVDVSAAWIQTPSIQLEMWQYHHPPTGPASPAKAGAAGYRHIGFCCANLDAEIARLGDAGIAAAEGDTVGDHRTAWTRDPDSNRIALVEIADASAPLALDRLADPDIVKRRIAAA